MRHPPEALRAFPRLSQRCALREGGRRLRCGAALAGRPAQGQRTTRPPCPDARRQSGFTLVELLLAIAVATSGILPPLSSPWFLIAYLGVTLSVAVISYRWFELPVQNGIRQRTLKRGN